MSSESFEFEAEVEIFPQTGGWHYVRVPSELSRPLDVLAERGLIAVHATIGSSSWPTSLLPIGDGTHFLALPAKVRGTEHISLGDTIRVSFTPRER